VRARLQGIGRCLLLVASLVASGTAEAGQGKYVYLKVGQGEAASAYAFTSKQACEAARRKYDAEWNRMINRLKKQIGNRGTFAAAPRMRCMDTLPLGFECEIEVVAASKRETKQSACEVLTNA
jgi:hypothetical protein